MRHTLLRSLVANEPNDIVWCLKKYTKLKQVLSLLIILGLKDGNW